MFTEGSQESGNNYLLNVTETREHARHVLVAVLYAFWAVSILQQTGGPVGVENAQVFWTLNACRGNKLKPTYRNGQTTITVSVPTEDRLVLDDNNCSLLTSVVLIHLLLHPFSSGPLLQFLDRKRSISCHVLLKCPKADVNGANTAKHEWLVFLNVARMRNLALFPVLFCLVGSFLAVCTTRKKSHPSY